MSMTEPFMPHRDREDDGVPAADLGPGGPPTAAGFGVEGEDPDRVVDASPGGDAAEQEVTAVQRDTPFRTPDPAEVRRGE